MGVKIHCSLMKNGPLKTNKTPVDNAPEPHSPAVRVDAAMTPLKANNLAQDLRWLHWGIVGDGGITPQDKGEPTAVLFLYIYYAMGNKPVLQAIEDNVSPSEVGRCYRFNRDQVFMANSGMHACSRGSKPHSAAEAQQLGTEIAKRTKTQG